VFLLSFLLAATLIVRQLTDRAAAGGSIRAYLPLIAVSAPLPPATPTPIPTSLYVHGSVGFDYSFPACSTPVAPRTSSLGTPYGFAIVGVNDGRPFTQNPCLVAEFQSAASTIPLVSFYINISAPLGSSASNGMNGPKGPCSSTDYLCQSYNFGYNAAQYAYSFAAGQLGTSTVAGRVWWLDVETANSWWGLDNGNCSSSCNDQVLQGAIDYFHQNGLTVGSYSVSTMWAQSGPMPQAAGMAGKQAAAILWSQIAGGYRPGVPEWVADASGLSAAPRLCSSTSFTGGPVWLVQELSANYYDEDYAC
jgi:hypothetical protein